MKILEVLIENYKKISVFHKILNGENLHVAGVPDEGKTTAISALWNAIYPIGDPVKHGEKNSTISITLGDSDKRVYIERKMTLKSDVINITSVSENEKPVTITSKAFKEWLDSISEDPHRIMDLKPLEKTKILLNCLELPEGFDLEAIDKRRSELENERVLLHRECKNLKEKIKDEPEKVEKIDIAEKLKKLESITKFNTAIDNAVNSLSNHMINKKNMINNHEKNITAFRENSSNKEILLRNDIESIEGRLLILQKQLSEAQTELERSESNYKDEIIEIEKNNSVELNEISSHILNGEKWIIDNPKKTDELNIIQKQIDDAGETNKKAIDYEKYCEDKLNYEDKKIDYDSTQDEVNKLEKNKNETLEKSGFPIEGLSINDGKIQYNGVLLDNCGTSKKMLICAVLAAVKVKKSKVHVVRMDGIESMSKGDFIILEKIFNDYGIQVLTSRVERNSQYENDEIVISEGIYNEK